MKCSEDVSDTLGYFGSVIGFRLFQYYYGVVEHRMSQRVVSVDP